MILSITNQFRIPILIIFLFSINKIQALELLNSSYDISNELFISINSSFKKDWEKKHPGKHIIIKQSHAGSSKQALSILQGLRADVVTYNQKIDIQILHNNGNLIPLNWQKRLPNQSSPFYSTIAFLVRKGNPKKIKNWIDLTNNNIQLIFSNPKTSGNARYIYLAAWEIFNKNYKYKTKFLMSKLLKNVVVFNTGGRGSATTFIEYGLGDVLISFESEINNICNRYYKNNYEIIIPKNNILAEFPVTWIDYNNVRNGTSETAKNYLRYLYTIKAQKIITCFYYRVKNKKLMLKHKNRFPKLFLFQVEKIFGNWNTIMKKHFSNGAEMDKLLKTGHK